jgi:hypothetical protein
VGNSTLELAHGKNRDKNKDKDQRHSRDNYANTLEFDNMEKWRTHETSQELLDFVYSRWVVEVDASEEMITITPRD